MTAATASVVDVERDARLPVLDGVRGLAALMVLHFHFASQPLGPKGWLTTIVTGAAVRWGWTGVDLFFVLSGFLITGLLLDAKGSTNYFRVFYARRALRILPLYYLAVLLLVAVPLLLRDYGGARFIIPFRNQLYFWFYLQNFYPLPHLFDGLVNHLWSLAIEEQFYLVWPLVIYTLRRENALKACAACLIVSFIWRIGISTGHLHSNVAATPARLDGLAVGSAIAIMLRGTKGLAKLRRYLTPAVIVAALVITLRYLLPEDYDRHAALPANYLTVTAAWMLGPFFYTAVAFVYGGLLIRALRSHRSFLESRFLRAIGRYSYGLYVVHVPMIPVLYLLGLTPATIGAHIGTFAGFVAYSVIATSASFALAWLSWHIYEKRFLYFKRYFVYDSHVERQTPRETLRGVTAGVESR